jgi:hypothetical protein
MKNIGACVGNWPFKSRNGNHRNGHDGNGGHSNGHNGNGHDLNGVKGNACPDLLCVGAQKAGTLWLYRQLEPHPDFWMPPVKELHYLDNLNRTKRHGEPRSKDERDACFLESIKDLRMRRHIDLDSYGRLFRHKGPLLSGDISPTYSTLSDEIIERVVDHFPNLKVIFLARDPVERAWSQLSMGVHLGVINKFEATDPEEVVRNLLIPGGDPDKPSGRLKPHDNNDAGRDKLRLTAKVRDRIAQFFEHELKACASELGGHAKSWPARYGFSLLLYFWDLLDDSIDLLFWCDWIC